MAEERRKTRTSGPRPRTRPGRPAARGAATRRPAAATARRRPRITGRAAVLLLVLAVLTVSYASSLRAYLTQREHLSELSAQIADSEEQIQLLEREKRRWDDPAYVEQQARERLDYVMPGETSYVVLDENGEPLGGETSLNEPVDGDADAEPDPAWWDTMWGSVESADDPQEAAEAEQEQQPAEEIEGPPVTEDDQ